MDAFAKRIYAHLFVKTGGKVRKVGPDEYEAYGEFTATVETNRLTQVFDLTNKGPGLLTRFSAPAKLNSY